MRAGSAIVAALAVALAVAPAAAVSEAPDRQAPSVLALPHETIAEGQVRLRAQVDDASAIGNVQAHVLTAEGWVTHELAPFGGEFRVDLPAIGHEMRYWFDATDVLGNGPQRAGSPRTPFLVRLAPAPAPTAAVGSAGGPTRSAAGFGLAPWFAVVPILLGVLLVGLVRQRRELEHRFWLAALTPLAGLRGAERSRALRELCGRVHPHPVRGDVKVQRSEALAWLEQLGPELVARPVRRAAEAVTTPGVSIEDKTRRELEDDMFWLSLLSPLGELAPDARDREITRLASRTHHHPHHGKRLYDRNVLQRKLRQVRGLDAEAVAGRLGVLEAETGAEVATGAESVEAGYTLAELLVTVALIGLSVVISAIYLKPLEAPVRTAGELVEGVMRQARARAISTTTVHRVRPETTRTLVVESSTSCSAGSWDSEAELGAELPPGVSFDSTSWSVCFTTRGLAASNITFTLDHPDYDPTSLEVLLGGAVRWID